MTLFRDSVDAIRQGLGAAPGRDAWPDRRHFAISALRTVFAALLVGVGMVTRYAPLRLLGLRVCAVAIVKILTSDVATLGSIWRILSLVCLGGSLTGVAYLYSLYWDRLRAGG